MNVQPIFLEDIADFLRVTFRTERYAAGEQGGIYWPAQRPVRRLGLLLEPFPDLATWVVEQDIDAIWLHRPWHLELAALPPDGGVLYHHLPFDETLTMGFNIPLARQIGAASAPEPLGFKQSMDASGHPLPRRPIGMMLDAERRMVDNWQQVIVNLFGGFDKVEVNRQTSVGRVAVAGAMNDALVREAADRGAGLYLTGQYRPSAQTAVDQTGMNVITVGHRRSEEWGLRLLRDLLTERWPIAGLIP